MALEESGWMWGPNKAVACHRRVFTHGAQSARKTHEIRCNCCESWEPSWDPKLAPGSTMKGVGPAVAHLGS